MSGEAAVVIGCNTDRLAGILHLGHPNANVGVIIAVGGPQYRVGSHRQFVTMARHLASNGFPVLRFDFRGMGDSEGSPRTFDDVDLDLQSAVNWFIEEVPSVTQVVLLGLCDAASAILMFVERNKRVAGLVLLNPWVRTEQGEAQSYLRHYYWQRLLQRSFWSKVLSGRFNPFKSARQLRSTIATALSGDKHVADVGSSQGGGFIQRMLSGFSSFSGAVLFLISGRDLTAQEFVDLTRSSRQWRRLMRRKEVQVDQLAEADHTLSRREHLDSACQSIVRWLAHISGTGSA